MEVGVHGFGELDRIMPKLHRHRRKVHDTSHGPKVAPAEGITTIEKTKASSLSPVLAQKSSKSEAQMPIISKSHQVSTGNSTTNNKFQSSTPDAPAFATQKQVMDAQQAEDIQVASSMRDPKDKTSGYKDNKLQNTASATARSEPPAMDDIVSQKKRSIDLVKQIINIRNKHKDRNYMIRDAELKTFKEDLLPLRSVMLVLCYMALVFFTGFSFWINLVYGIKFDLAEQTAWIRVTFITLALDILIVSLLKIMVVWVVPPTAFGVVLVISLVLFIVISAFCSSILSDSFLVETCNYLSI